MKSKVVFIAVAISLSLIIAGLGFYLYQLHSAFEILRSKYSFLQEEYATLKEDYNALVQKYASLESEYGSLESGYASLSSKHEELSIGYSVLEQRYISLTNTYSALESDYDSLVSAFDKLRDAVNQRSSFHRRVSEFITPKDPAVSQVVMEITGGWSNKSDWYEYWEDIMYMYHWVRDNIEYRWDGLCPLLPSDPSESILWVQEMWQFSNETLELRKGDCEDMAILLCSMILCYGGEKYKTECIDIHGSGGSHLGVQLPVGDRLIILDPAGNYYTSYIGGMVSKEISVEIKNWLSYWKRSLGDNVRVVRVFANYMDKTFDSTSEYISWMYSR